MGHDNIITTYNYVEHGSEEHKAEAGRVSNLGNSNVPPPPETDNDTKAAMIKKHRAAGILTQEEFITEYRKLMGLRIAG